MARDDLDYWKRRAERAESTLHRVALALGLRSETAGALADAPEVGELIAALGRKVGPVQIIETRPAALEWMAPKKAAPRWQVQCLRRVGISGLEPTEAVSGRTLADALHKALAELPDAEWADEPLLILAGGGRTRKKAA